MRIFALYIFLLIANLAFAQAPIDLKTLIGKPQHVARQQLETWGIAVSPSHENLWVGYDEGIQIKIKDGIVTTIWVEFTDRRTGAFPFAVDPVVTPNVDIHDLVKVLGKPSKVEDGFEIDSKTAGWVKWNTKAYQLHCQLADSKVYMVTLMEPDWYPGKD